MKGSFAKKSVCSRYNNYTKHLEFKDFGELKQKAYTTAKKGIQSNFSEQWRQEYIGCFWPSSNVWHYEELIDAYAGYLTGSKTKTEAKEIIEKVQQKSVELNQIVKKQIDYLKAENEAFTKAGIEFGEVEFTCPLCSGKAIGVRYKHSGGRVGGLGSHCTNCGVSHT